MFVDFQICQLGKPPQKNLSCLSFFTYQWYFSQEEVAKHLLTWPAQKVKMIDKTYRNPRENEIHPQIQKYLHQIVIESFRNFVK